MMMRCLGLILLLSQWAAAQGAVTLDKLSDCAALATLRSLLERPLSRDCRAPRTSIEARLMSQLVSASTNQACLLSATPVARLADFSCIDLKIEEDREISCFRTVDVRAISNYTEHYDSIYAAKVTEYLDKASHCDVGKIGRASCRERV